MANKFSRKEYRSINKGSILSSEAKERLETLSENVSIVARKIKSGDANSVHTTLTLDQFHSRLYSNINTLSSSCTNLSVLLAAPPSPSLEEVGVLSAKIETICLNITSTFCQCRLHWGKYHFKEVQQFVVAVLNGVTSLAKLLMTEGCKCDSKSRLQGTGSVWEHCERINKLSINNKRAVVKVCMSQLQLLRDANSEVNELASNNGISEGDMDDLLRELDDLGLEEEEEKEKKEGWTSDDKPLITSSIELIKITNDVTDEVCRMLLKYTDDPSYIEHLDNVADWIVTLSPLVDEVGSEIEAPVDQKLLRSHCLPLCQQLLHIVNYLSQNESSSSDLKQTQTWTDLKLNLNSIMVTL